MGTRLRARQRGLTIVHATQDDIAALVPTVRRPDVLECWAAAGQGPLEALEIGLRVSARSWAAYIDGDPVAIFGVVDEGPAAGPRSGRVWLIGTTAIRAHYRVFARASRQIVEDLFEEFDILGNYVDSRNELHLRWLSWLGFKFVSRVEVDRFTPDEPVAFLQFIQWRP